jgi:hypothetical protein
MITIISKTERKNKSNNYYWVCRCEECGNLFETVNQKTINSCRPCSKLNKKHNLSNSKLFNAWSAMKARCYQSKNKYYHNYGERGISICDEWKNNFMSFYIWSINNGYQDDLSIDRIDNDGNYEPSNCRWADKFTQLQNTRLLRATNKSGYRGVSFFKRTNKWKTQIYHNNRQLCLGYFYDKDLAAKVYNDFVIENNLLQPLNKIKIETY